MKKFEKLNREEMKAISGGAEKCSAGQWVLCNTGCFQVTAGQAGQTPFPICIEDGAGTSESGNCFNVSPC